MIGAEAAFEAAAGTTASHISLLIRTILYTLFMLWAAWNVYGQMQLIHDNTLDIHDLPMTMLRILLLCALMVVIVFVK